MNQWTLFHLIAIAFVFHSCANLPQHGAIDVSKTYRMDLDLEANGRRGNGVLVVAPAEKYVIRVRPSQKPDTVILNTCHREISMGRNDRDFTYEYVPTQVEREGFCPLELSVFSQKLWYQGGLVVTKEGGWSLPASLLCNGQTSASEGVSACQSKSGLIQQIVFPVPVNAGVSGKCGGLTSTDGLKFEFKPKSGQCAWVFREKTGSREHLLTTVGYDQFLSPQ